MASEKDCNLHRRIRSEVAQAFEIQDKVLVTREHAVANFNRGCKGEACVRFRIPSNAKPLFKRFYSSELEQILTEEAGGWPVGVRIWQTPMWPLRGYFTVSVNRV